MNIVDSSGWMAYLINEESAEIFAPIIQDTANLLVSSISLYEVYKKLTTKIDERLAINGIVLMKQVNVIPVTEEIALNAAKLSIEKKIPMADSIIYTTGILNNATVWTQDCDFINLPNVKFIKK